MSKYQREIMFFGRHFDEVRDIKSSISYSMEKYRTDLTVFMNKASEIMHEMKTQEKILNISLINDQFRSFIQLIPEQWEMNQLFLEKLLDYNRLQIIYSIDCKAHSYTSHSTISNPPSYESIHQLLIHLARDWGIHGAFSRNNTHESVIRLANQYFDLKSNNNSRKILVPGAGLGRLALELASRGYNVEANECSGAMITAFSNLIHTILPLHVEPPDCEHEETTCTREGTSSPSWATERDSYTYYPFLHFDYMDEWDMSQRHHPSYIPPRMNRRHTEHGEYNVHEYDVEMADQRSLSKIRQWLSRTSVATNKKELHGLSPFAGVEDVDVGIGGDGDDSTVTSSSSSKQADNAVENVTVDSTDQSLENNGGSLSVEYGNFLEIYSSPNKVRQFDGLVTCFFLDTAENILDYLVVISQLVKASKGVEGEGDSAYGGVWINAGPLHYHKKARIPYDHQQVMEIVRKFGFDLVHSEVASSSYCGEDKLFMKPEYYNFPISVWRMNRPEERFAMLKGRDVETHSENITSNQEFDSKIDDLDKFSFIIK